MSSKRTDARPLATPVEVAEYLALDADPKKGVVALEQHRYRGTGPRFIKVDARHIRYRWSDVEEWLDARTHTRTDDHLAGAA